MHINITLKTINQAFDDCVRQTPNKHFILHKDETYTYREVERLSNGLCNFLGGCGVKKGERVCFILPRVPELIIAFMAILKAGGVPVPVNYTMSKSAVREFIRSITPTVIIVHEKLLKTLDNEILTLLQNPYIKTVLVGLSDITGFIPWKEVCYFLDNTETVTPTVNDIAYLNYTTGSTGKPKGAVATHANIYWNTLSAVQTMGIDNTDVHLCMFASFAHPHELFVRAIYTGGAIALVEEINPKTMAREILDKSITCMMGLAPMFEMMNNHCSGYSLPFLKIAESGGMYTKPNIIKDFKRHFGIPVLSVWGSTETTGIAIANSPQNYREDGSMGRICPYYDIMILDEGGSQLAPLQTGEILISGQGVIEAYYEGVEFPSMNGWYKTGDLGYKDEEGFVYFMERNSGLLKIAGLKVYPLQVEIVILKCPGVKEVAVIGAYDRKRGEIPVAFVIKEEGHHINELDIVKFCKNKIADYMIPKKIEFVADMPRIGSGKINKKAIKDSYNS